MIYLKNHRKWSKYLREGEDAITEDELRRRKRQYFTDQLFYKHLCGLVDKIHVLHGKKLSAQEQEALDKKNRQEQIKRELEETKKKQKDAAAIRA